MAITVLAAAAVGSASSMSAATDGLSADSILAAAREGGAFGSGLRVPDDPDAPITTGRWAENAAPVELAGGPAAIEVAAAPIEPIRLSRGAPPTDRPVLVASLPDRGAAPAPVASLPLSRISLARPAIAPPLASASPRINLTISDNVVTAPGAGLDVASTVFNQPLVSLRPPPALLDIRRLALQVSSANTFGKKGRWFIFAAGSGQAFGLNLLRDPLRGWKPAGWSVEQLAEFGKAQLGIGWRQDSKQVALSAARREVSAYGVSREDTVLGVTFTVSGRGAPTPRHEQRLPRAH